METLFLMLLLTQNGAGDINAAFVSAETMDACELSRQRVAAVFESSRIPILYQKCQQSELRFTPFWHANSSATQRQFYLVELLQEGESFQITQVKDYWACREKRGVNQSGQTLCASSVQQQTQ